MEFRNRATLRRAGRAPARHSGGRWAAVAFTVMLLASSLGGCVPAQQGGDDRLAGQIEVLGVWSGLEQQRFEAVLRLFSSRTGAVARFTSSAGRDTSVVLAERLGAGKPPDVALLPQPGLLRALAAGGHLTPLSDRALAEVRINYSAVWRTLASWNGQIYGVWFKAANKSLIWYDVAAFERVGVVPPRDLRGLVKVGRLLTQSGRAAFAVSARTAWTLTDWFEDLYLRVGGPQRYDQLAAHQIPWTHPSVRSTLRMMATLLAPTQVAGGIPKALRTTFEDSVASAFGPDHAAAMLHEGDFAAGVISSRTRAEIGVDVDVFAFPGGNENLPAVVGGGDVAVMLRPSPAAGEFLRFLATPDAAAVWAARGGFVSPNLNLDLSVYPDDISRSVARNLLDAGNGFHFDLSDLQPSSFGGQENDGLQRELRDFLIHRDIGRTAARLEQAATSAYVAPGLFWGAGQRVGASKP